jgi:hypothetical protein
MPYQRKPLEEVHDDDKVRLSNTYVSGAMYKFLCNRADKKGKGFTNYSSFLIEELLHEFAAKNSNDLIGD